MPDKSAKTPTSVIDDAARDFFEAVFLHAFNASAKSVWTKAKSLKSEKMRETAVSRAA